MGAADYRLMTEATGQRIAAALEAMPLDNTIADAYSSSATYAVGDYCIYNNTLYKCNTAISTAEAWTPAHWTATTVSEEFIPKTDIVDNLDSTATEKPLSAAMGKFLSDHYGHIIWEGSAFTSGSMAVPDLDKYRIFVFYFSDTVSILATKAGSNSIIWGGLNYGMYGFNAISTVACRYASSDVSKTITIDSNNRGYTDGTNSNYSGKTDGLIRIVGIV